MKKILEHSLLLFLFSFVIVRLLGCQNQLVDGIVVVENPGTVGFEKVLWSPVDFDELLITSSVSGFLGESEVYIYNLANDSIQEVSKTSRGDVFGEGWSLVGNEVILLANIDTEGYENGGLWLWDRSIGTQENLICCKGIDSAAFINQNQILYSPVIGTDKGFADMIVFDIENWEETNIFSGLGKGYINTISYSPLRNEAVFAVWNDGVSTINILRLENNSVSRILADRTKIDNPTWSPNGEMIAFTEPTSDGLALRFLNPESGCEKEIPETFYAIFGLTWSPDSQKIAFINEDDEILIVDLLEVFNTEDFDSAFLCD